MACRSGEQNVLKVLGEHLESFFFSGILEEEAHFAFHARLEQAFPSILAHVFEVRLPDRVALDDLILQITDHFFVRDLDGEAEHLFLFATAESEHTVARDLGDRFAKVVVVLELGFLLFEILLDLGNHDASLFDLVAEVLAVFGVVCNFFGEDVCGTLEGGTRVGKALFFGQINACNFFCRVSGIFLSPHQAGERFQTKFLCNRCASTLLRLERSVNIFEKSLVLASFDLSLEFRRELALFLDALEDRFLAVHKFLEVIATVADVAEFNFVQSSRLVLAVTGDKGDRAPLVHKFERLRYAPHFKIQLFSNNRRKIHLRFLLVDSVSGFGVHRTVHPRLDSTARTALSDTSLAATTARHPVRGFIQYSKRKCQIFDS